MAAQYKHFIRQFCGYRRYYTPEKGHFLLYWIKNVGLFPVFLTTICSENFIQMTTIPGKFCRNFRPQANNKPTLLPHLIPQIGAYSRDFVARSYDFPCLRMLSLVNLCSIEVLERDTTQIYIQTQSIRSVEVDYAKRPKCFDSAQDMAK